MNSWKIFLPILFLVISCSSQIEQPMTPPVVITPPVPPPLPTNAKNVIFLIGDGMGLTQVAAAIAESKDPLHLQRFKHIGLHENSSSDDLITDSAAGATAFSIGRKAKNGSVGLDANGKSHKTIMEEAMEKGMAAGLVATSTIVHATPASFVAHVPHRGSNEKIAAQMSNSGTDIMIGGGLKFFNYREDERDLVAEMTQKGYECKSFLNDDIKTTEFDPNKKHLFLTASESPIPFSQGRDYLLEASTKTIDYLHKRGKSGFMAMIEGSQIDWGGHANNYEYVISELMEFDKVVGAALDFARKDGETLVVVTADHETGGLTILKGSKPGNMDPNFSSDYHTYTLIPVYAYGPGAEYFQGMYPNTEIYRKLRKAMNWDVSRN